MVTKKKPTTKKSKPVVEIIECANCHAQIQLGLTVCQNCGASK